MCSTDSFQISCLKKGELRRKKATVYSSAFHLIEVAGKWCETELLLLLPMPSVVHDNLRPEAGLEDWRGEMGSAVSDWVAPQAPGFIHLQPRRLSLQVLVSPNLPSKDKKGQENENVDLVLMGSIQ